MNIFTVEFIIASFLIFVRVSSILMTAPFFGSEFFPTRVKLFFAVAMTVMLYPVIPMQGAYIPADATLIELVVATVQEVLVGATMGLVGQVVFGGVQLGGQFISIKMGLGFANMVDPLTQDQSALVTQLFMIFGVILFLAIDGEHMYIQALYRSFDIVPIGEVQAQFAAPVFMEMASQLFIIGVQLSAPFMIVLFILDLAFAIFGRIMPKANVFFIALPLKVLIGLTMVLLVTPNLPLVFDQMFDLLFDYLGQVLQAIGAS